MKYRCTDCGKCEECGECGTCWNCTDQRIAELEAEIALERTKFELVSEAYWNHDDYGFSRFEEIDEWATKKAEEQS